MCSSCFVQRVATNRHLQCKSLSNKMIFFLYINKRLKIMFNTKLYFFVKTILIGKSETCGDEIGLGLIPLNSRCSQHILNLSKYSKYNFYYSFGTRACPC